MTILLVFTLAWGALAFGAVYSWAYWPLAGALGVVSLVGLVRSSPLGWRDLRWLAFTMALVAAAVGVQLAALPIAQIERLSPHAPALLQQLVPGFAAGAVVRHSLSIDPAQTRTALVLFATFAVAVLGIARLLSRTGAGRLAGWLVVLGVVVALAGIVQKPFYAGRVYGFWQPESHGSPFGPFINKNHFAGWMLMAIPLALGLFSGGVARGLRRVKPEWRERLVWLSSPDASRLLLVAGAALVLSLSLVMTMSRSGMSALALTFLLAGWLAVRRAGSSSRGALTAAYLAVLVVVVIGWVGADAIAHRFDQLDEGAIATRSGAWADAWAVAADFPLTGTGLNTYGVATLFYQRHDLTRHYAQAHNDYLQLAAEGGLLLTVPAALCAIAFALAVRRRFREDSGTRAYWLRAGAVIGLLAIAFQEAVEFSLQMPGNAALFAVLCAIALHRAPRPVSRPSPALPRRAVSA